VDRGSGGQNEKGQKEQEPAALVTGMDRSRGGRSPAMADLGRPALIQDEVKSGRTLAARVIHLGGRYGGLGLGSTLPTAEAARGHRRTVVGLSRGFTDHNIKRKRLQEMLCCSPRRSLAGGRGEGRSSTMTVRRGGRRSRRQVLQGWPGPLDGGKRPGGFLRRCKGNQQDQNGTSGDELEWRGRLTGGGCSTKFR
jgi:hypothetical protein